MEKTNTKPFMSASPSETLTNNTTKQDNNKTQQSVQTQQQALTQAVSQSVSSALSGTDGTNIFNSILKFLMQPFVFFGSLIFLYLFWKNNQQRVSGSETLNNELNGLRKKHKKKNKKLKKLTAKMESRGNKKMILQLPDHDRTIRREDTERPPLAYID